MHQKEKDQEPQGPQEWGVKAKKMNHARHGLVSIPRSNGTIYEYLIGKEDSYNPELQLLKVERVIFFNRIAAVCLSQLTIIHVDPRLVIKWIPPTPTPAKKEAKSNGK